MKPEYLLILSSLGLVIVITYAWLAKVRTTIPNR